jgi:hypothetical protein
MLVIALDKINARARVGTIDKVTAPALCPQYGTLIRHAAPSGAILAAAVGMHLPPVFARLISAPCLPLPAAPLLHGAITTTVHLAAVTSAADTNLMTTTAAKK